MRYQPTWRSLRQSCYRPGHSRRLFYTKTCCFDLFIRSSGQSYNKVTNL